MFLPKLLVLNPIVLQYAATSTLVCFKSASQPHLNIAEVDSVASYTKEFYSYCIYSSLQVFLSIYLVLCCSILITKFLFCH